MSKNPQHAPIDVPKDIAIDYALIVTGVAAGVIGLICLMLT
jgi:hypothetical protein